MPQCRTELHTYDGVYLRRECIFIQAFLFAISDRAVVVVVLRSKAMDVCVPSTVTTVKHTCIHVSVYTSLTKYLQAVDEGCIISTVNCYCVFNNN